MRGGRYFNPIYTLITICAENKKLLLQFRGGNLLLFKQQMPPKIIIYSLNRSLIVGGIFIPSEARKSESVFLDLVCERITMRQGRNVAVKKSGQKN